MSATTFPKITVTLTAVARCPMCRREIRIANELDEEALTTGNHTQRAAYWAGSMRAQVAESISKRGWRADMCGRCADPEPKADERTNHGSGDSCQ